MGDVRCVGIPKNWKAEWMDRTETERTTNTHNTHRQHLIHERVIAPREWRRRYSLSRGAVFGLSHDLLQLSLLRPGM